MHTFLVTYALRKCVFILGVVSNDGQYPSAHNDDQDQLLGIGPMCRYAHDVKLVLKILVDKKADLLKLDQRVDISRLKASRCNVIRISCIRPSSVLLRQRKTRLVNLLFRTRFIIWRTTAVIH